MSASDPPSEGTSGPPSMRCPRCGGVAAVRSRRPEMRNPFLTKKAKPEQLTCEDCGLDFDRPIESGRDSGAGRDSGRSPWSRP